MTDQLSQLDPAIAEVIRLTRAEIKVKLDAEAAASDRAETERLTANHAKWDALEETLRQWQPRLVQYWQRPPDAEDTYQYQYGQKFIVQFDLPGLAPICAYFEIVDGAWQQAQTRDGKYNVARYTKTHLNNGLQGIDWRWQYQAHTLPDALVQAADEFLEFQRLSEESSQHNAAQAERAAVNERLEVQRHIKIAEGFVKQATEREAMLNMIADDPVAVALVKLYAAVREERHGYQQAIDRLNESMAAG